MRLTLRTLLAYLDDTLEPAQARLIGQKVAESDVAQQLIERIKQVTRRRGLTAPAVATTGTPVDPHIVADYLDNVLPAEKLAEIEEVCLTSDVHLAEIAACHQILTQVLGEPARVPPTARQRMYALIQGRKIASYRKRTAEGEPPDNQAGDGSDEADEKLLLGLPLFRQLAGFRKFAPLAGVLVLVVAAAVAIWQALPPADSGSPKPPAPREAAVPADGDRIAQSKEAPKDKPVVPVPPEKLPVEKPPDKPPAEPPATGKPPEKPPTAKPPPDQPAVIPPSAERRDVGKYVSRDTLPPSVLLQRPRDQEQWRCLPPESRVFTTDYLVSLPGCRSEVLFDSGVYLRQWGNLLEFSSELALREERELPVMESTVVVHAPAPPIDLDVTLDHGRIVLTNHKPKGEARVRVRFHDEVWDLTLIDNRSEVALELWGRYPRDVPFTKEAGGEGPTAVLLLATLQGQADLKIRSQVYGLPSAAQVKWHNTGLAASGPQPLTRLPEWWVNQTPPQTPAAQEMLAALKELRTRLSRKDAAIEIVLAETRQEPKAAGRILGVLCFGAIDATLNLMDALEDQRPDVRGSAIYTLRHWIGRRADHDLKLYGLLHEKKGFSKLQAEIIMQLLHSFSEKDAGDPTTYEQLIAYLKHERLAVRELAYWHMSRLAPEGAKKIPYNPAGDTAQRERAYELWKKLIPEGKLPPRG